MRRTETLDLQLDRKTAALSARLAELGPVAVALSGGVDSTLLLNEARRVIGDRAVAVTGVSLSLCGSELEQARRVAEHIGAELIELETHELASDAYRANRGDRCFHCKHELYGVMSREPRLQGYTVVDGTHAEDPGAERPGMRAATDLGVESPLRDAGFGKADIRGLARFRNLPNWDRPARPCLASRVAVGTEVDERILGSVEAMEAVLEDHGFSIYRARVDDRRVVVEVGPNEVTRLDEPGWRRDFLRVASERGYRDVFANVLGYRGGVKLRRVSIAPESAHR